MGNKPFRIAIVGGIAVGKSTIIKGLLQSVNNCFLIEEDVSKNIFLSDFYADMRKWAFHSRISTLAMIAENYLDIPEDPSVKVILMDRCLDELITFAKMHYDRGNLSDKEFEVYKSLYRSTVTLAPPIDLFLYVNCSAEKSLERIKERNRVFEQGISIDYIRTLNDYYNTWIESIDSQKVISINTENSISTSSIVRLINSVVNRVHEEKHIS